MITTQLNHKETYIPIQREAGLSLTVPNQALTIREILRRSGVIDVGKQVYYDQEPDHDNADPTQVGSGFDLSDATEMLNNISQRELERIAKREAKAMERRNEAEEQKAIVEQSAKTTENEVDK